MVKDGQKDIITIKSNGNKQTYHVAASICSSKSNSGSQCGGQFPRIISRQLLEGLNQRTIKKIPDRVSLLGN